MTRRKKANLGDPKTDAVADSASEHEAETLTKQKRRQSGKLPSLPYIPTDREQEILSKQYERQEAEPPVPPLKIVTMFGAPTVVPDHPNRTVGLALLQEAIGAGSREFLATILVQLGQTCSRGGEIDPVQLNFMFSVVRDVRPRDQLVAMLAIQMATVSWLIMTNHANFAHRLERQENVDGSLHKLMRTYAMQMETLKRYQTGGEQKVTVHYVSVNEGGQAIVANMTQDARESVSKRFANKPLALTNSRQEPMPVIEEQQRERDLVSASRKQKANG